MWKSFHFCKKKIKFLQIINNFILTPRYDGYCISSQTLHLALNAIKKITRIRKEANFSKNFLGLLDFLMKLIICRYSNKFSEGSSVSHMCKKAIFCCFQKKTTHVLDAEQKVYSTAKSFIKKYWRNKKLFKIEIFKKMVVFPVYLENKAETKKVCGVN